MQHTLGPAREERFEGADAGNGNGSVKPNASLQDPEPSGNNGNGRLQRTFAPVIRGDQSKSTAMARQLRYLAGRLRQLCRQEAGDSLPEEIDCSRSVGRGSTIVLLRSLAMSCNAPR